MNKNLQRAKDAKNDEFYTQLKDIENELKHYKNHFKGKVVYCNADDPRISNFFHYFSYNFEHLGLKKLITTCYKNQELDFFSIHDKENAIALVYEGEKDNGRVPTVENIGIIKLKGDGDFRSKEAIEFLKEADIVVTNPPFSLFREYIDQLMEYEKKFLVIGNYNAVAYKEIFPLFQQNKIWIGNSPRSMQFKTPSGELHSVNASWFTNLDIKKRHEEIILYKKYNTDEYIRYDNYNAIEISKVSEIPKDYEGVMGVPITFLENYNPEQFNILGLTSGRKEFDRESWPSKIYVNAIQHNKDGSITSGSKANTRATILMNKIPKDIYYTADNAEGPLKIVYARILIKNKKVVK